MASLSEPELDVQQPIDEVYATPSEVLERAQLKGIDTYRSMHQASLEDDFWEKAAKENLDWIQPFTQVRSGGFQYGDIAWFLNGKLNVSYNCVDRHAKADPNKVAIIYEADELGQAQYITYGEVLREVSRIANVLKTYGVKKGDRVIIYMPMVPEAAYAMLACTRIGAPHSVVFAGFSAEALRDRVEDCRAHVIITADEGIRAGRSIPLKKIVDDSVHLLDDSSIVQTVLVHKRTGNKVAFHAKETGGRDVWLAEAMNREKPYCPCEVMDSEDILFLLYTSGSTGKPKGMVHTTAGYLLFTALTHRYTFDYQPGDIYACVADVGWITGHSYIVYGPMCNGATTVMFESTPVYPDAGRYWDLVQTHKVTSFYTAPTAIRLLMKYGTDMVQKYDRSSLRVMGSVGEPINPSAWRWYYEVVGEKKAVVVDTYWQTESGGHLLTPLPGCTPTKPGSATFPFFGIDFKLLDIEGKELPHDSSKPIMKGLLAISKPWPSIARTVWGDHQRYLSTYFAPYPGYYFTGDSGTRDKDGYFWVIGRVDDVVNVSGHRMGTAELESALVSHDACAEAAVIAVPHEIKGQAIVAFCILKENYSESPEVATELKMKIRQTIGPFAQPDLVVLLHGLPKTRSGKIMRRILRKLYSGESLGDLSTITDAGVVEEIQAAIDRARAWTQR